jgi:nucleoside-diphosphate-sugar epimerase
MKTVLVTGATGFIGTALCRQLRTCGWWVRATRHSARALPDRVETVEIGDIGPDTAWSEALAGVDAVVHLAARVHVMRETATNPLAEFRRVNTAGSARLAAEAARVGVRRLVFVSSIKVNGEGRTTPYTEADPAAPQDAYALSKWEAERSLMDIAQQTGLEVVILRPPLVYGPAVGGNFLRLLRLANKRWPLPLSLVENHRSLLFVGNLSDAIRACLEHPAAANQTFLVSDDDTLSTPELIRRLTQAMGKTARLLPVPVGWLRATGRLLGRSAEIERLIGSLVVDNTRLRRRLGWQPPFTVDQGLRRTVDGYKAAGKQLLS